MKKTKETAKHMFDSINRFLTQLISPIAFLALLSASEIQQNIKE